ncbi:TRADD-N-associated membrane domain-containing protein [Thiolinea disciformis]|uniref:TRADD-N-associated membrane domain-containing protein n=1 Tax=Thiolinea disciformis TaxID=125614 RepID=UPI0003748BAF|nr:hypothetical protein [Thiolinea disciformis]
MNQPEQPSRLDNLLNPRQHSIEGATRQALQHLSDANEGDVKAIAASQIQLLSSFYDLSLLQAGRSFRWALVASIIGMAFFVAAIAFMLWNTSTQLSTITLISGGLVEVIAGVNFYLYGRTLAQLNLFQGRLEVTQRFLLANSLCESLGVEWRDKTRARLINKLASGIPSIEQEFYEARVLRADIHEPKTPAEALTQPTVTPPVT